MKNTNSTVRIPTDQFIESIPGGLLITDMTGHILSVNSVFTKMTGFPTSQIKNRNIHFYISGRSTHPIRKKIDSSLDSTGYWDGEVLLRIKNKDEIPKWLSISPVVNHNGKASHLIWIFNDNTRKRRTEQSLRYMTHFDPLTGLPNRTLFFDRLKQALPMAKRYTHTMAVLFLDLDRVKIINNTLGHAVGDVLLQQVANRLKGCVREGDTMARLGGDEFMFLISKVEDLIEVNQIAERILESLSPPFHIKGNMLYITGSIGISLFPKDGENAESLTKYADTAMNKAKQSGRNTYQIFDSSMKEEAFEELEVGNNLRRALENDEFILHYQPQLDIKTGKITGVEALIRWQHPEFGMVPPQKFIRWAEDSGLIIQIGEWVLKKACKQVHEWQRAGLSRLNVAVNLSASQFKEENLIGVIERTLSDTGLPPDCLDLELTESVVMENVGLALSIPHDLRAMGIRFSIDDFGTGYSSFSYLKHFPVNTLKMDQSFVRGLSNNPHDSAIASAVIALGHGLNLSVVAEGVETELQLDILKDLKCDRMQGFLFSKPLAAEDFENLMRSNRQLSGDSLFEHQYV